MRIRSSPVLAIFLCVAGCSPSVPPHASASADGIDCIPVAKLADTQVRDDQTIDFVMQGRDRLTWRNHLTEACPHLGRERTFAFEATASRICRLTSITVLQNGHPIPGPACLLGGFTALPPARH